MSILVSVCSITYNHEKYISQAIESFLMQKTNFEYEILIGEDCSTDSTRQIVLDYQSRFPDKIRLITSERNVGARQNAMRLRKNAVGKYIADCEGDDYWTDPEKLQKQVDYMEAHPECAMCVHAAEIVEMNGETTHQVKKPRIGTGIVPMEDVLRMLDQPLFMTSSLMFRKFLMDSPPAWYIESPVGDYPLAVICASQGNIAYLDSVMSVYRRGVPGSWCSDHEVVKAKRIDNFIKFDQLLRKIDDYTGKQYNQVIAELLSRNGIRLFFNLDNPAYIKELPYSLVFTHMTFVDRCRVNLKLRYPALYQHLVSLYHLVGRIAHADQNSQ